MNTPERLQGKQDIAVSTTTKEAAELVETATSSQPSATQIRSWVYIGDVRNDGWHVRNFDLSAEPKVGQSLRASANVFKRAAKPTNLGDDNWRLGEIQGVLAAGSTVKIRQLYPIDGYGGGKLWGAEIDS